MPTENTLVQNANTQRGSKMILGFKSEDNKMNSDEVDYIKKLGLEIIPFDGGYFIGKTFEIKNQREIFQWTQKMCDNLNMQENEISLFEV